MSDNERKQYDEQFKKHLVSLYDSGQKLTEISKSYNIHSTTISNWVKYYKNSGNFKAKGNLSVEEKTIRDLEKQLKDQQMEIDILKKAMVVMLKN